MTKRDYEILATTLRDIRKNFPLTVSGEVLRLITLKLSQAMLADNPRFSAKEFERAIYSDERSDDNG
jgi:hypothetical protein